MHMQLKSSQKGYALFLMLIGLAAASLSVTFVGSMTLQGQWYLLTQDAYQLNNERARLIYYSVDYARLYGSGGAGPGHMPCPDTDEGLQRPGPNPPCAKANYANGKLPDGVTRAVGRVALTDSLLKRSAYSVSRALVNNPAMPINSMQWADEVPFELSNEGYVSLTRPSGQKRILTKKQIEKPTLQWVRAWLSWQLLETSLSYCEKESVPIRNNANESLIGFCSKQTHSDESVASGATNAQSSSVKNSCVNDKEHCVFSNDEALSWLTDDDLTQWQGTRLSNHWFIKNRWVEMFEIETQNSCLSRVVDCVLYLDVTERTLRVRLLPDVVNVAVEDDV